MQRNVTHTYHVIPYAVDIIILCFCTVFCASLPPSPAPRGRPPTGPLRFLLTVDLGAREERSCLSKPRRAVELAMKERAKKGGNARAIALTPEQRSNISRIGGQARVAKLSPEDRSALARKAALARWGKVRQEQ